MGPSVVDAPASAPRKASPPRFTVRTEGGTARSRTSSAMAEGTVLISVTWSRAGRSGSSRAFSARITVPPQARVTNSSKTDMSKQIDVEPSTPASSPAE